MATSSPAPLLACCPYVEYSCLTVTRQSHPNYAPAVLPAVGEAAADAVPPKRKTRVVVLGSGWGAVAFLKNLDWKGAFGRECSHAATHCVASGGMRS